MTTKRKQIAQHHMAVARLTDDIARVDTALRALPMFAYADVDTAGATIARDAMKELQRQLEAAKRRHEDALFETLEGMEGER